MHTCSCPRDDLGRARARGFRDEGLRPGDGLFVALPSPRGKGRGPHPRQKDTHTGGAIGVAIHSEAARGDEALKGGRAV